HAVDDKTNEITAVEPLLRQLVLEGRIVTMDALLTQRHIAQTIVDKGGDYVMIVKENQPHLRADIELVFMLPPVDDCQATARTVDLGHGRIEQRNLTTSAALVGYSDWPGLAQVFELGRHVLFPKTGKERVEVVYGVTSLRPDRATPERLLALVRGQWQIENQLHWVRDVTFDEDRSQVRCGNIPHVMAALRNTTIGLLRQAGYTNIAAACRRLAAQPVQALALVGIALENSHSTRFRGGVGPCSSKASRREDLQVEEPVACGHCASFDFHPTLASVLSPTLIGHQVVEVRQPREKHLLAPFGVMEAFHREQLPLDGV